MLVNWFYNNKVLVLCSFVILMAGSAYFSSKLKFEHHLERFFPDQDADMAFLDSFKQKLEADDLFLLIAIDNQKSVFDTAFWMPFNNLVLAAEKLPYITKAVAVTNLSDPLKTPFGFVKIPLLKPNEQDLQISYLNKLKNDERIWGGLINDKGTAALIVLKTKEDLNHFEAERLNDSLFSLLKSTNFTKYHVAGKVNTQTVFVRKTNQEMFFYIGLSLILLIIILFVFYPSFWGVVVPLFSVLVGLLFFMAYMQLSGQSLDIMSSLFPILMLIFGMSDTVHLQTKYIDELLTGKSRLEAMQIAIKEIGNALLLTSATTTIGFASLYLSHIPLIRQFGINAAVGVMLAYFVVITFAATFLTWFNASQIGSRKYQKDFWEMALAWWLTILDNHKKVLITGLLLVLCFSFWGITRISTNTNLLSDIPKSDRLRQDFDFVENELGGVRSMEIAILPQLGFTIFDPQVLQETSKLEAFLQSNAVGLIQSPTVYFKTLNKAFNGGVQNAYKLPNDSTLYPIFASLIAQQPTLQTNAVASDDGEIGRISGKMRDTGSDSLMLFNQQIKQWIAENINHKVVQFQITGTGLLVDKNHEYLRKSLFSSLLLAFLLVGLIFAALFKDWRMVPISFLPNIIPLIIAGGAMGWLGIELKALTSIIFTTSFGIAVDDTIHLLGRYRIEKSKGANNQIAIKSMLLISGKAVILTTIILIAGFGSLAFSDFTGTFYIGILVSITLLSALISDLILIPYLLQWLYNPKPKNPISLL